MGGSTIFACRLRWRAFRAWDYGRLEALDLPLPPPGPWAAESECLSLAASPDGRWIAGADGERAWLCEVTSGQIREISSLYTQAAPYSQPEATALAWSPDGRWIAHALTARPPRAPGAKGLTGAQIHAKTTHYRYDLRAGAGRVCASTGTLWGVFPDGDLLEVVWEDGFRLVRRAVDGAEVWSAREIAAAQIRPDGQAIAVSLGDQIWESGLANGPSRALAEVSDATACDPRYAPDGRGVAWVRRVADERWCVETARGASVEFTEPHIPEHRWIGPDALIAFGSAEAVILDAASGHVEARYRADELPPVRDLRAASPRFPHAERGFLREALRRIEPAAPDALAADWRRIVDLFFHDDPGHQRQAAAVVEALDEPALRSALTSAAVVQGGALRLFAGDAALTAPQIDALLGAPDRDGPGRDWRAEGLERVQLDARALDELRPLQRLGPLESFSISRSGPGLAGLEGAPRCRRLVVFSAQALGDLSGLSGRDELEQLELIHCGGPQVIDAGLSLSGLTSLQVILSRGLRRIDVSGLPALETLGLENCGGLSELAGLARAPIVELRLRSCSGVTSLAPLAGMGRLERLDLAMMRRPPADLEVLAELPALQVVDLNGSDPAIREQIEAMGLRVVARPGGDAPWT